MFQWDPEKWTVERVGGCFVLFGALLALTGLIWMGNRALFLSKSIKTEGQLIEIDSVETERYKRQPHESSTQVTRHAIAEFKDEAGQRHEIRCLLPMATESLSTGDVVIVHYNPLNPKEGFIDHWMILWFAPGLVLGMGLFFVGFVGGCLKLMH